MADGMRMRQCLKEAFARRRLASRKMGPAARPEREMLREWFQKLMERKRWQEFPDGFRSGVETSQGPDAG